MAPPSAMYHNTNKIFRFISTPQVYWVVLKTLDTIKFWNILPYNFHASKLANKVCSLFDGKVCDIVFKMAAQWHDVDNLDRKDMYISNLPAGSSVYSYGHYGQLIMQKESVFKRYDYGKD